MALGFKALASLFQRADEGPTFVIDQSSIPPEFFGLASYSSPVASVAKIDRKSAMSVPAVKRCRDLICGSGGSLPLDLIAPDKQTVSSPLLAQPEAGIARVVSLTQVLEDLLLEKHAWWQWTEFADGFPTKARRIDPGRVEVRDGQVYIDGTHVPNADAELCRFDSPNDGLLTAGARSIRALLLLDAAALRNANGVPPVDSFTPTDPTVDVDTDEVTAFLGTWTAARQQGGTAFIPGNLKYASGQALTAEQIQLADSRQHATLDIARLCGVDAEELGVSTTSRTYYNAADRDESFIRYTLAPYLLAVEQRLSMPDVVPEGHTVKFNTAAFLRGTTAERYATYATALSNGILTLPEVRELEDRPPLPPTEAPQ